MAGYSVKKCTNDTGNTPLRAGSPSTCPIHHSWSSSPSTTMISPSINVNSSGLSAEQLYIAFTRFGFGLASCDLRGMGAGACVTAVLPALGPGCVDVDSDDGSAAVAGGCGPVGTTGGTLAITAGLSGP